MKIADLLHKKLLYGANLGDEYYWDYRFIVEVDDKYYCLLNYQDSVSGWVAFQVESIDEEFLSDFLETIFVKTTEDANIQTMYDTLFCDVREEEVILIKKSKVDVLLKEGE